MNAVWFDGFEIPDWSVLLTSGYTQLPNVNVSVINTTAHQDGSGRGGSYCMNLDPVTSSLTGVVTPAMASPRCVGGAFRLNNSVSSATDGVVLQTRLTGLTQCCVLFRSDGYIQAFRNTTSGTSLGVSASTIAVGIWHWFSVDFNVANAGSIDVRVNGVLVLSVAGDTQQQASPAYDQIVFGTIGSSTQNVDFDDLIVTDSSLLNIPETYLVLATPTGNGTTNDFTPSGAGTNWEQVDENPPNTSDYNETAVAAATDLYSYPALPFTPTSIGFVAVSLYAAREGAITGFQAEILSNSVPDSGAVVSPASAGVFALAHAIFPTDPDTLADWTEAGVNALEAGITSV